MERVFFRNSQKLTQNLAGNVLVILCLSGQWLARADAFPAFVPGICCTCRQNSSLCILISKSFCEVQYGCMYHSGICAAFALLHSNFEGVIITHLVGLTPYGGIIFSRSYFNSRKEFFRSKNHLRY